MDNLQLNGTYNVSQMLFLEDQAKSFPGDTKDMTKAYLDQSRLSTYYQDSPWQVLTFPTQFNLNALGGPINGLQPPGSRPGNLLMKNPNPVQALPKPEEIKFFNFYSFLKN